MNSYRLYRNRTLTENMNMVFDFVSDNWKLWLKLMVYFLLPFSVLLGTTFATFYKDADSLTFDLPMALSIVLFVVGSAVVTALMILLVKWYETHDYTLDGCNVSSMWRMLPGASLKCLGFIVIMDLLMGLSLLLAVFIIGIVAMLALLPLFLLCPIMLLEPQNSFLGVFNRAFSLGYKKWGALILIALVMSIVAVLLNNAVTFPLGIFKIIQSLLEESTTDSMFFSLGSDIFFYVMCVAECFMIYVEMGLFILAMTYHYGSVAAEVDDIGLESDIDNFAQLK